MKIWRVEENRSISPSKRRFALDGPPQPVVVQPSLKTLAGRNVLLGPLVEATFTAIAPISNHRAIVCTEKGDVCLLDDSEGQKLIKLTNIGFFITCLAVDVQAGRVRIGGRNGRLKSMFLEELLNSSPPESPKPFSESAFGPDLCAMGYAANSLITVDSNNTIEISSSESDTADPTMQKVPAHGDSVLGIVLLSPENKMNAVFLTWSANGTIVFWDLDGNSKGIVKIDVEQLSIGDDDPVNQCQIVRAGKNAEFLVTGDKYGVLRVLRILNQSAHACELETRAHMSDIQDIAIYERGDMTMLASCSRDRTVQLFRLLSSKWVLFQTLDDHSASVCSLFFAENGERLVSCSTDRTIHIRQLVRKDVGGQDIVGAVPLRKDYSHITSLLPQGLMTGNLSRSLRGAPRRLPASQLSQSVLVYHSANPLGRHYHAESFSGINGRMLCRSERQLCCLVARPVSRNL